MRRSRPPTFLIVGAAVVGALLVSNLWQSSSLADEGPVRTARDFPLPATEALDMLREGNARYVEDRPLHSVNSIGLRAQLAKNGQNPAAVVIGCADSRCPVEAVFDARPGDLFVLRNAGNACRSPEGSLVASVEYAVGALGTKLIVVLGHTNCGAMAGATQVMIKKGEPGQLDGWHSVLDAYLTALMPAAKQAVAELPPNAELPDVAELATRINVWRTARNLVEFSPGIREEVARGEVQVHGAIYDIVSGKVEFMGEHPHLKDWINAAGH